MSKAKRGEDDLLPLVQRSFDLCVTLYAYVHRVPRAYRTLLGRDLLTAAQEMLIGLIRAARCRERISLLQEADIHLETARILVRLSGVCG